MPDPSAKPAKKTNTMSLPRQFDVVSDRVGWAALFVSFVGGLIWATASGKDYPLIAIFPLITIFATRLVGRRLGAFVGHVAKHLLGLLTAWLVVSLLLSYTRLHDLPADFKDGRSDNPLLSALGVIYATETWIIIGIIAAAACELLLALFAALALCLRRAMRIAPIEIECRERSRWYQLSLRTILLLLLTLTVGTGWFATRVKRAQANRDRVGRVVEAVAAIEKLGGRVYFSRHDDERKPTWLEELFDDTGNPDNPIVEVTVRSVRIKNVDALDLISELDNLKLLEISEVNLSDANLRKVGEMKGLELLSLRLLQVEHLGALGSIQSLDLSKVHVEGSDPDDLPGLKSLTELTLGETSGFFEHVGELPSLRKIKLLHNGVDATLKRLHRMPTLREVDLRGSDVTDEGLRHLTQLPDLEQLRLGFTGISDSGLIHVGKMTKLEVLSLAGTKLTDQGMENLSRLTRLRILDLSRTGIGDAGLEILSEFATLVELNLLFTQITDSGLAHLGGLKLYSLNLSHTQISNSGLAYLAGMSSLRSLILRSTNIDDAGLRHLMGLTDLRELRLDETGLTDAGIEKLRQALSQCHGF